MNHNESTRELARKIRVHALEMVHRANASHIGSCLSMADLLAVLYGHVLRIDPENPTEKDRDIFILSKGHGAAALYAALSETGFFPLCWLDTYCEPGSKLQGHSTSHGVPGIEISTGSLGHGLPVGAGMAIARKREGANSRVVVLIGDGELNEGTNWESALFAAHHHLDNLIVIIDLNSMQGLGKTKDILDLTNIAEKWRAFDWACLEIDGHDHTKIRTALANMPLRQGTPSIIIARTIKGKGVSFMENELIWHYKSPDNNQLAEALAEIGDAP